MKNIFVFFLLGLLILGCVSKPEQDYKVIRNESEEEKANKEKLIGLTEFIEQSDDNEVLEFKEGRWTIAVHSFKTDYTYYYDENNKLLGRRSEFSGNPREDLLQQRLKQVK